MRQLRPTPDSCHSNHMRELHEIDEREAMILATAQTTTPSDVSLPEVLQAAPNKNSSYLIEVDGEFKSGKVMMNQLEDAEDVAAYDRQQLEALSVMSKGLIAEEMSKMAMRYDEITVPVPLSTLEVKVKNTDFTNEQLHLILKHIFSYTGTKR